ncbi:hypothetical protein FIA58_011875 [Flavobacterium jejuense]|uniref:Uncharacterized protein n=1 Tax=Flavobacterium jejuense TaxID=1544455 RepID=A0ABX0IS31_9FLAO|nr:hypothetical protein [Flavobacterium jejuense]NHN26376.1 hypothetical protein [Flavobacterium jejuense]
MKIKTISLIASLTLGVLILSQCKPEKSLLYNESGNYLVDGNFLIQNTKEISAGDINKLLSLDKEYADITKGKAFLSYIVHTQQIQHLQRIQKLDKISRIQKINFIHKGCFEKAEIDWSQFGELKNQLDLILDKYKPTLINGNIAIANNQIATKAVRMNDKDISTLSGFSIYGLDDANICGDFMGVNKYSRVLFRVNTVAPDKDLQTRLEGIIKQYR